ncbi:TPA: ATP-binding protein [Bacillus cereus]|nr:ATP-binding protein [Bacillus cereus]
MDPKHEIILPNANAMIQSLRSIGYSVETAIADIIDNSIDASAHNIKVDMVWTAEKAYIRIEDDGIGMSEKELIQAMKIGSHNPLTKRGRTSLGRFGMGLKTAAFSIGKRLTVRSKVTEGMTFTRCWDLDYIEKTNNWSLLMQPFNDTSTKNLGEIQGQSGTVVLIENLDRIINTSFTETKATKFFNRIEDVGKHLSMVFHRFLEGPRKIELKLNENTLTPWDPFLIKEFATQELPEEKLQIKGDIVSIQSYVLPHHTKLDAESYERAGGPKGWLDQQGFYIYRNRRLLVSGSWLNLFGRGEAYKLARIKVDISNESDFEWQIDIKKSSARPPQELLPFLKKIGEKTRGKSYDVFYHRGIKSTIKKKKSNEIEYVWEQVNHKNQTIFKLNRSNSLIKELISREDDLSKQLKFYLFHVEEYCPANIIRYHISQTPQEIKEPVPLEELKRMKLLVNMFKEMGMEFKDITDQILNYDSFKKYEVKELKKILEEIYGG